MQSVHGPRFLNFTFLLILFNAAPAASLFGTVIVPLIRMFASLESHKLDLIMEVLNLMLLL